MSVKRGPEAIDTVSQRQTLVEQYPNDSLLGIGLGKQRVRSYGSYRYKRQTEVMLPFSVRARVCRKSVAAGIQQVKSVTAGNATCQGDSTGEFATQASRSLTTSTGLSRCSANLHGNKRRVVVTTAGGGGRKLFSLNSQISERTALCRLISSKIGVYPEAFHALDSGDSLGVYSRRSRTRCLVSDGLTRRYWFTQGPQPNDNTSCVPYVIFDWLQLRRNVG